MKYSLFLILLAFSSPLWAQTLPLQTMGGLPSTLNENSGLEFNGPNRIWSHNDGGDAPKIYEVDSTGSLKRTVTVLNANNVDWEDMTQDVQGNFYIGDFGNNSNNRQDLVIYKIINPDSLAGDSAIAGEISFQYPDQVAFPPPAADQNFDMEAMVAAGDSLYLFSKNRTNPWDGLTKLYRLPQDTGTYTAELLDSFYTGSGPSLSDWVTGAALSPNGQNLILQGHGKMWLFSCFPGRNFFAGNQQTITLSSFSQKEAIVFRSATDIFLSDEKLSPFPGPNLYYANLQPWVLATSALGPDTTSTQDSILISAGSLIQDYQWNTGQTSPGIWVDSSGTYTVTITSGDGCSQIVDSIMVTLNPVSRSEDFLDNMVVYPNPVERGMPIAIKVGFTHKIVAELWGLDGKMWKISTDNLANGLQIMPKVMLPTGLYLLKLIEGEKRRTVKVTIR